MIPMIGATARAVWNGPFYIGRLTRPVSLGEVAMKLLETMWRGTIVIAAIVAVVTASAVAWDARPRPPSLSERIAGTATVGRPECDATYPLSVALKNNSKKRIGNIGFKVAAYEPGRSTNLATAGYNTYVSDFIIPAGKTLTMCWEAPRLNEKRELAGLRFLVTVTDARATGLP